MLIFSFGQKVDAFFKAYAAMKVALLQEAKSQKIEKKEGEFMQVTFTDLKEMYEVRYLESKKGTGFAFFAKYDCEEKEGICFFKRLLAYEQKTDGTLNELDQKYFTGEFLNKLEGVATAKIKDMSNAVIVGKMPMKGNTVLKLSFIENPSAKNKKQIKIADIVYDAKNDVFNVIKK